ncbi:hydantoinase B/oxoprolinase family protein [Novosphingobium mangrovi (ex Huang et al. 2023)]|uniref:Hydantoinase B/oxoprolinase family protein n=1 Tax=Novosphingobium mangrovi (ex Huang et al. 2023) TaxID=2976432 RepID=A0ABT2IA76_9SPHN|nr:hydantoinase B/oxoprolinase family protein [Novosphingobium mangrovi (ex Huang et al. 2023)]MCT2401674.1 hydantoinase B/oxoprolinase family protein [Novosphingobium mangrovi (ex Huang et al. 2023)]
MSYELNRKLAARREPLPTTAEIDQVTADIIRGAFETVCFEAATYLGRAASSPIINQSNERNAAIVDAHGRLAMGAIGTPQLTFVNQMETRWGLMNQERYDWGPGDVFVANDPDHGGGHLPDYNVYGPVYDEKGELICIQTLQAHQGDTGGKDPGGFTLEATDVFTEGVIYPCLKLVHRGELRMDVFDFVVRNNRFATFAGDIAAMIGGVQHAVKMLEDLLGKWGAETVKAAINHSIDHTEKRMHEEVAKWPDGTYEGTVLIDHDTAGTKDIKVHVACTVKGDQLTVDLTGTDDRQDLIGVWNTFANSRSYVMTQVITHMDPTIVRNEGMFNAVDIVIPEGCIAQPPPNKPAALGSFHPACEITEAVCLALSQVAPERAQPQLYKIGMPNAVIGFDDNGMMWMDQGVDCRSMDVSAIKGIDGWGSCPNSLGNLILSEAEDAESRFPILNISREMTTDGGGAGQWRGAPGSLNVKQVLKPTSAMAWMVSADHPLRGMCGGDDAIPYSNHFEVGAPGERKIEHTAQDLLPEGAVIAYQHGGGAGFGLPLLRDPESVKEDVLDEYVSPEAARMKYGVVLTGSLDDYTLAVDHAATEALRAEMSAMA